MCVCVRAYMCVYKVLSMAISKNCTKRGKEGKGVENALNNRGVIAPVVL